MCVLDISSILDMMILSDAEKVKSLKGKKALRDRTARRAFHMIDCSLKKIAERGTDYEQENRSDYRQSPKKRQQLCDDGCEFSE